MAIKNIITDSLVAYLSQMIIARGLPALSGTEQGRFPKWLTPIIVPKSAVEQEMQDRDFIFDSPLRLTTLGFALGFAGFLWYASREMDRAQLSGAEQMEFDLSQKQLKPHIELSYVDARGTPEDDPDFDPRWVVDVYDPQKEKKTGSTFTRVHTGLDTSFEAWNRAEELAVELELDPEKEGDIQYHSFMDTWGNIYRRKYKNDDESGNVTIWTQKRESARIKAELDLSQKVSKPRKGAEPSVEILYIGATRYGEKWGIKALNTEDDLYVEANTPEAAWKKAGVISRRIRQRGSEKPEIVYVAHYGEAGHVVESAGEILDLGKEMSEFWEASQPELFKAKRTLSLEMEDIAKSDDPIFACMERRGYTQKQIDGFSDSIAEKATVDMFRKKPEDLTSSESKFQDDIQDCIETVTKVFGSLEAAGYEEADCDCDAA